MPMTPVSEKPLRPVFSKRNLPCFVLACQRVRQNVVLMCSVLFLRGLNAAWIYYPLIACDIEHKLIRPDTPFKPVTHYSLIRFLKKLGLTAKLAYANIVPARYNAANFYRRGLELSNHRRPA